MNIDQIKQRLAEYLDLGTQNPTADLLRDCLTDLEEQEAALAQMREALEWFDPFSGKSPIRPWDDQHPCPACGIYSSKHSHAEMCWLKRALSTDAGKSFLERLQKAEAQIQLQASFIGQLEDAVGPDLSVQEAVKGIGELKDRLQAVEKAGNIVLEAYSFIQNGTREPVSFTMKRPENDEKVFRLVIALNNFRKALQPAPQPKEVK